MRLMHCADLHLDSPFDGLSKRDFRLFDLFRQAPMQAFERAIDRAISTEVDVVLISGDLYNQPQSALQAQLFLIQQFERLKEVNIPVVIAYGNHDFLANFDDRLDFPSNVFEFPNTVETILFTTKSHEQVAVTGFSYDHRWLDEDRVTDYPLRDLTCDFHIGMLHGGMRQSNQGDHQYAPFTIEALKTKGYDYWALGHIHQNSVLNVEPFIAYSGNPQGLSFKETGPKGVYFADFEIGQPVEVQFYETAIWQFERLEVDISGVAGVQSLSELIEDKLTKLSRGNKNYLINIVCTNWDKAPSLLIQRIESKEFLTTWFETKGYRGQSLREQQETGRVVYLADIVLSAAKQITLSPSRKTNATIQYHIEQFERELLFDEANQNLLNNADWRLLMGQDFDADKFQADVLIRAGQLLANYGLLEEDDYAD